MSFCFIILFVTIWCKDNKLIIYLSEDMNFKTFVSETGKVAVSACILSSNVRWRRIIHE
jgi:hypothetical protein